MLTGGLIAAALLAGLAGAWSPCGLSMVETIAPQAVRGRAAGSFAMALAFLFGAVAGGIATFGGLAVAGDELGAGGGLGAALAVAALLVAAAGDAAGRRIVPQVRRQVPESWRRVLPLGAASFLYGILLGLGFTTFVLSFATYGLAVAALALGDPATGAAIGLAFAAGRAIPVLALAPALETDRGIRIAELMTERPAVLRRLRLAAATALGASALLVTLHGAPAQAASATLFQRNATNPSAAGGAVAWQVPRGGGMLMRDGGPARSLPGAHPAVSRTHVAWVRDGRVELAPLDTLEPERAFDAPGAETLALSDSLVVWRDRDAAGLQRVVIADTTGGAPRVISTATSATWDIGRPVVDGRVVAFDITTRRSSRIVVLDLSTGTSRSIVAPKGTQLLGPSLLGSSILYVRGSARRQEVVLGSLSGAPDQVLWSTTPTARRDEAREPRRKRHRAGYPNRQPPPLPPRPPAGLTATLWTTALTGDTAYVTRLMHRPRTPTAADVFAIPSAAALRRARRAG